MAGLEVAVAPIFSVNIHVEIRCFISRSNFCLCVGGVVFGVPQVGLFFGFCFVCGLFFVACWGVAAAFFSTQCMGWADCAYGGMLKPPTNPQTAKTTKSKNEHFLIYC